MAKAMSENTLAIANLFPSQRSRLREAASAAAAAAAASATAAAAAAMAEESQTSNKITPEEEDEEGQWKDMLPEALAKIFALLSWEERLVTIPMVCKAWKRVSNDPACWQAVDLREWSRCFHGDDVSRVVSRMVHLVMDRSRGSIKRLCVANLEDDEAFKRVASSGGSLQTLCIPFGKLSPSCVQDAASQFGCLTYLDISNCTLVTKGALEEFGRCCKSLLRLDRNMSAVANADEEGERDDEALAIAQNMSQLEHLELAYGSFMNTGLLAVLENCTNLQHLDVRGCWFLDIRGDIAEKCSRIKVFYRPELDLSDFDYTDDWEEHWETDVSEDLWDADADDWPDASDIEFD